MVLPMKLEENWKNSIEMQIAECYNAYTDLYMTYLLCILVLRCAHRYELKYRAGISGVYTFVLQ